MGWSWGVELSRLGHQVWVLTRAGNRAAIESKPRPSFNFIYYDLPRWMESWRAGFFGKRLYYVLWQWCAARHIRKCFPEMPFEVVQHVTYVSVRYPSFMGSMGIPFYFGPVSGGEEVPPKLRKDFSVQERWRERLRDVSNRLIPFDPLLRRTFRQAEKIIVTRDTVSLVPRSWRYKCEVRLAIGLTADYLDQATAAAPHSGPGVRMLYVGRLLESKGVDIALRAVWQLKQRQIDVRFIVVGDGPARRRLAKLAERLGLSQVVEWVGCVPRDAVEDRYRDADLFLFPSLCDSGAMAVLEAMAHGLPIVCMKLGGPGEMVNERCGRVLETLGKNRDQLTTSCAEAVREIMTTPGLRNDLAAGAKARAREFDFQKLVRSVYPGSPYPATSDNHDYSLQYGALAPPDAAV